MIVDFDRRMGKRISGSRRRNIIDWDIKLTIRWNIMDMIDAKGTERHCDTDIKD